MSQITTHILDTTRGKPAVGVPITLFIHINDEWKEMSTGVTNDDGRISDLLSETMVLEAGTYRMHFDTKSYFDANDEQGFYPFVDIVFNVDNSGSHYHIPLLLTAYGYSTYRGS